MRKRTRRKDKFKPKKNRTNKNMRISPHSFNRLILSHSQKLDPIKKRKINYPLTIRAYMDRAKK